VGNFLGDFVKGSQLDYLPADIELGIRLHRSVDVFTDTHPLIVSLKDKFPAELRRMAGVVIDIYFDYLLMQNWDAYSKRHFDLIFEQFYTELELFSLKDNPKFSQQAQRLKTHRWLNEYSKLETCHRAFLSIETRLNHKIIFAEKAQCFVQQHALLLESTFEQFYPKCLEHGLDFTHSYQRNE
jgi:acyl carrier protein phosphodiesterase